MSRRLETRKKTLSGETQGGENYAGRLVKYIPADIVALYLGAKGIPPQGPHRTSALWWIFSACFVLTFVWLVISTRKPEDHKGPVWRQVILATVAFPIWVFAVGGGPFDSWNIEQWVGSLILVFGTFLFGLVPAPAEEG